MEKARCPYCDKYEKQGHNYCRMCGKHLRPRPLAQYARLALAYHVNEKFCGYCGGEKHKCKCVGGKSES